MYSIKELTENVLLPFLMLRFPYKKGLLVQEIREKLRRLAFLFWFLSLITILSKSVIFNSLWPSLL
mgnify:CR=1 FL=1